MRFLVDAQLPPALCRWLREGGGDGAILVSRDEDFVLLRLPDRFALLWLRCGNAINAALTAWLEPRWERIEALLDQGDRAVLSARSP